MKYTAISFLLIVFLITPYHAQAACTATDKLCVMDEVKAMALQVEQKSWRDKIYRELAKSYTYEGHEDKAIALLDLIKTPDTKAMTIRAIGMAAADKKWNDKDRYDALFKTLTLEAKKIDHPPSHGIAYTYIAMAQAFAGDDVGATATAKTMTNEALRNKAFGESAEIQAERGDYDMAMQSIAEIESVAFRNKAYGTITDIFVKDGKVNEAYKSASKIDNAYAKSQALQHVINYGNEEESLSQAK